MAEAAHDIIDDSKTLEVQLNSLRVEINQVDESILMELKNYRDSVGADEFPELLEREMIEVVRTRILHLSQDLDIESFELSQERPVSEIALPASSETEGTIESFTGIIRRRIAIAHKIGEIKKILKREIYDKKREESHMVEIRGSAETKNLPTDRVEILFRDIMSLCREAQKSDTLPKEVLEKLIKEMVNANTESHRDVK